MKRTKKRLPKLHRFIIAGGFLSSAILSAAFVSLLPWKEMLSPLLDALKNEDGVLIAAIISTSITLIITIYSTIRIGKSIKKAECKLQVYEIVRECARTMAVNNKSVDVSKEFLTAQNEVAKLIAEMSEELYNNDKITSQELSTLNQANDFVFSGKSISETTDDLAGMVEQLRTVSSCIAAEDT